MGVASGPGNFSGEVGIVSRIDKFVHVLPRATRIRSRSTIRTTIILCVYLVCIALFVVVLCICPL